MYYSYRVIYNYDTIPLWAYGIDIESLNVVESLERIELRKSNNELDLLCDLDFLFGDFI